MVSQSALPAKPTQEKEKERQQLTVPRTDGVCKEKTRKETDKDTTITYLVCRVVKVFWGGIGPERGFVKSKVDGAHEVVLANPVLVPEHQADLVRHGLALEHEIKRLVPDRVQALWDDLRDKLVAANRKLDIRVRGTTLEEA